MPSWKAPDAPVCPGYILNDDESPTFDEVAHAAHAIDLDSGDNIAVLAFQTGIAPGNVVPNIKIPPPPMVNAIGGKRCPVGRG